MRVFFCFPFAARLSLSLFFGCGLVLLTDVLAFPDSFFGDLHLAAYVAVLGENVVRRGRIAFLNMVFVYFDPNGPLFDRALRGLLV